MKTKINILTIIKEELTRLIYEAYAFVFLFFLIFIPMSASGNIKSQNNQVVIKKANQYQPVQLYQLILAEIAVNRRHWSQAVTLYLNLAKITNDQSVKANAAELLLALGLSDEAKALLLEWNRQLPENVLAKIYLVKLYLYRKDYKKAEDILYHIKPNEALVYEVIFLKGLLAFDMLESDKAMMYFKQLLNQPNYQDHASLFIAKIYLRKNEIDQSITFYKSIKNGMLFYHAQLALITLYVHQKKTIDALKMASELLTISDSEYYRKRLYYVKGTLELLLFKNNKSLETFNQAIIEFPNNENFYYLRGLSYMNLDQIELAKIDMEAVLKLNPNHPGALSTLGFLLAEYTKRYDESYQLLKKAQKLAPKMPQVLDSLGWLMYKKGDHKEALNYLQAAYDLLPYGMVALHYASVLKASGQDEKAERVVQKIKMDKANGDDVEQLIQYYKGKWND